MKIIFSIQFIALIIYSHVYNFHQKMLYISVDTFNLMSGSDESVVVSFGYNEYDFQAFTIKKKGYKAGG